MSGMRPDLVLAARDELRRDATTNDTWRRFLTETMVTIAPQDAAVASISDTLLTVLDTSLAGADAFRVEADMTYLIEHAAGAFDADDTFDIDLLPAPHGFVRFERPIILRDNRGTVREVNWLTWATLHSSSDRVLNRLGNPARRSVLISYFNDAGTPDDALRQVGRDADDAGEHEVMRRMVARMGRFWLIGFDVLSDGDPIGGPESELSQRQLAIMLADGHEPMPGTNSGRHSVALWALLDQTVTDVSTERPRPRRGGARRMPVPEGITVVKLRRTAGARQPGESNVQWAHRWVVKGHWRKQRYGVGRTEVRRIWIAPFVKGPEDAPFVQTRKLYDLAR